MRLGIGNAHTLVHGEHRSQSLTVKVPIQIQHKSLQVYFHQSKKIDGIVKTLVSILTQI
jgi:hypothetical protein